jgi:hypothetical protein
MTTEKGPLSGTQYAAIAAFRTQLRRFLAFSEAAAGAEGLAQQQHQALLVLAGYSGDEAPGVGTVAEALLIAPPSRAFSPRRHEKHEDGALDRRREPASWGAVFGLWCRSENPPEAIDARPRRIHRHR